MLGGECADVVGGDQRARARQQQHHHRVTQDVVGELGDRLLADSVGESRRENGRRARVQTGQIGTRVPVRSGALPATQAGRPSTIKQSFLADQTGFSRLVRALSFLAGPRVLRTRHPGQLEAAYPEATAAHGCLQRKRDTGVAHDLLHRNLRAGAQLPPGEAAQVVF